MKILDSQNHQKLALIYTAVIATAFFLLGLAIHKAASNQTTIVLPADTELQFFSGKPSKSNVLFSNDTLYLLKP